MNPREMKFLTVAAIVAAGLGLAGCGGGGSSSPPALSMLDVTAPVMPGTYSVSAAPAALVAAAEDYEGPTTAAEGESLTIGSYTLTCTAGPCSVSLSGGTFTVTGTISVFGPMAMMMPEPPPPEPTAYEAALAAINAATTAAAAQEAYDAVDQDAISGSEATALKMALDTRLATFATAARIASQKMALSDAAGMIDTSDLSTAEAVAAARTAIAGLVAALAAAEDVSDADKAMYQSQIDAANMEVATAQAALDTQGRMMVQRMAISDAVTAAEAAVNAVNDASSDAEVMAADNAIAALQAAIAGAADLPDGDTDVASAQGTLGTLTTLLASAKASRQIAMDAADDADRMARLAAARETVSDAIEAARTAVAMVDDESTDEEVTAADNAVAAAKTAIDDAAEISDDEKTGLRSAVAVVETDLADAKESRTTAIAKAEEDKRLAEEKAERDAITKAAGTKLAAINAEGAQGPGQTPDNPDAGLGGSDRTDANESTTDTDDDVYGLSIKRDRDGTTIKITDPDNAGDDDPKFVQSMDLGGGSTMHTRTMKADDDGNVVEEVVVVTTDIEEPKATAFAKVSGQALNKTASGGDTASDEDPLVALGIAEVAAGDVAVPKIMAARFTAGTAAVLTFDMDDASTTKTDESETVKGTYNGASGTYSCEGSADCTVTIGTVDDELVITGISAGWIFTPDEGATSDVPDANYLNYGFWLKKTTDEDGVLTYNEVETFAGSNVAGSGSVAAVLGTATYSGGATGVYVHHRHSEGGGRIESSTAGHFTADASLTANFGGDDVAVNKKNSLTGTIDNFMLSGGEEQDWSVALKSPAAQTDGTHSGTAKGGVGDGSFSATFHGDVTAASDGTVPKPSAVVGEFNAGFSNGAVAGAFGATLDE